MTTDLNTLKVQLADLVEVAVRGWQQLGGTPVSVHRVTADRIQIGIRTDTALEYLEIQVRRKL